MGQRPPSPLSSCLTQTVLTCCWDVSIAHPRLFSEAVFTKKGWNYTFPQYLFPQMLLHHKRLLKPFNRLGKLR